MKFILFFVGAAIGIIAGWRIAYSRPRHFTATRENPSTRIGIVELPLKIVRLDKEGLAQAWGYWLETTPGESYQELPAPAKIRCLKKNKTCMEYIARIDGGDPKGGAVIYNIRNWTEAGIVADTIGVESCRVIQKLSLDFKTGAVTKTDYLGDVPDDMDCYQLEPEFNYYNHGFDFSGHTLHGGSVVLSPVPTTIFKVPGL